MRIRSTKPEFWRSKTIAALPWDVRLVLKGLESYVDDNGVGKDDIALVAADVFPRDLSANAPDTLARLTEAVSMLVEHGLVVRYAIGDEDLIYIDRWKQQQRIDKPAAGRYPRPDGTYKYSDDVNRDSYASPRESVASVPEAVAPRTGEQGNRGTGEEVLAPATPPRRRDEIFDVVAEVCGITITELTKSARGELNAACKQLREVEAIPGQVKVRAAKYRRRYPETALTPSALAKHWAALGGDQTPTGLAEQRVAARRHDPLGSAR